MTMNGTKRLHSTDGHTVLENETRAGVADYCRTNSDSTADSGL